MKTLTLRLNFYLNAYWFSLAFMWNSLHVIILPAVLLYLVPNHLKNTYLGLLTLLGLIIAILVQPLSGALSDRWVSRWGRRRPLIFLGTAFDFVFLALLGWAGGLGWLALGYIGLQFSSNIAHGPAQGLLPDQVSPEEMGRASGFKSLMELSGTIVSSLLVGRLLTEEVRHPVGVVGLAAVILAAGAAALLLGVKEQPVKPALIIKRSGFRESLRVDWRGNREYFWLIASRFCYLAGIYGIQTFAQYFVRDVLAVPNPIQFTGDLLAAIVLAVVVFALIGGRLGDRIGHKPVSLIASLIGATGCALMLWARTPASLLLFGGLLGVGIGLFQTANWALANQLAPNQEAGKYLGLTNLATGGAGVVGRLEGPLIDVVNNARPGLWLGYQGLFILGILFILASALLLRRVQVLNTSTQIAAVSAQD